MASPVSAADLREQIFKNVQLDGAEHRALDSITDVPTLQNMTAHPEQVKGMLDAIAQAVAARATSSPEDRQEVKVTGWCMSISDEDRLNEMARSTPPGVSLRVTGHAGFWGSFLSRKESWSPEFVITGPRTKVEEFRKSLDERINNGGGYMETGKAKPEK